MAHLDNAELALCKRKINVHGRYYVLTPIGRSDSYKVATDIPPPECRLDPIGAREIPCKEDRGRCIDPAVQQINSSLCVLCSSNSSWRSWKHGSVVALK